MSFSLGGLASGLDTSSIIQQLMQIERQPVLRLEKSRKSLSSDQSIFRAINTKLKTLDGLAYDLSQKATFNPTKATISDETVAKVSSSDTASSGTYELDITKLAKAHVVQSGAFNAADDASALVGQTFTLHHEGLAAPVTIEAKSTTNNTYGEIVEDIKNQVNNAKSGVSASVIETSPGVKELVFTSTKTGTDNRVTFGTATDGTKTVVEDSGLLASLGISDGDADGEIDAGNVARAYQDAEFTLNGVSITRSTNNITDVVEGVTFDLLKAGSSTITVGQDTDKVADKLQAFVDAYNDVITTIRSNIKKDGKLQGDSTLRGLESQLYQQVTSMVGSAPEGFQTLEQLGITIDKGITSGKDMTGTMTLNKDKLVQKLNEDTDAVMSVFRNTDGIAKSLDQNLNSWTGTVNGIITNRITGFDREMSFIKDRIDQLNSRLQMKEASFRKQFAAMEVAMANAQSQQQWLSGQFAQLSNGKSGFGL